MDIRKLKFFVLSFIISIVYCSSFMFIIFNLLLKHGNFEQFLFAGGLILYSTFLMVGVIPTFVIGLLLCIVLGKIISKGDKPDFNKIFIGYLVGFLVSLVILVPLLISLTPSEEEKTLEFVHSKTMEAIKEKNKDICSFDYSTYHLSTSSYVKSVANCYQWYGFYNSYEVCSDLYLKLAPLIKYEGRDIKSVSSCWFMGAIKTKNVDYCKGAAEEDSWENRCIEAMSKVLNDPDLCEQIPASFTTHRNWTGGFEESTLKDDCYIEFALFNKDIKICNKVNIPRRKEFCEFIVLNANNFKDLCKSYADSETECLSAMNMYYMDKDCSDPNSVYCEYYNTVSSFKNQNKNLCKSKTCEDCFNLKTNPTECDYSYYYFVGRFEKLDSYLNSLFLVYKND